MINQHIIDSSAQIQALSDPRRLQILRRLMANPATISQLGRVFGEHPAWIRHHLKKLEKAGLVQLESTRVTGGYVEKFYAAIAPAFVLQNIILSEEPESTLIILMGSHDLALELLAAAAAAVGAELGAVFVAHPDRPTLQLVAAIGLAPEALPGFAEEVARDPEHPIAKAASSGMPTIGRAGVRPGGIDTVGADLPLVGARDGIDVSLGVCSFAGGPRTRSTTGSATSSGRSPIWSRWPSIVRCSAR